jgi:DNA-directed RNA polymerase III subunit RPC2
MIHQKKHDCYEQELNMYLHILESDKEKCSTQKDAILRIGGCFAKTRNMKEEKDILSYISHNLHVEQLPNLTDEKNHGYDLENFRKGENLAQGAAELICLSPLIHKYKPDINLNDKRSYTGKRIDTPGEKLAGLARKYIKEFARKAATKLKSTIEKQQKIDLNIIFNRKNIKLTQSVKNGVWDCKTDASDSNQNKTQMMITGFCSDANHMQTQKIMKFAIKKNSNPETLLTHPSQVGRIDVYLTPESDKCGIVRFKTMGCCISQPIDLSSISLIILHIVHSNVAEFGWIDAIHRVYPTDPNMFAVYDVFGGILGWVKNPVKMYEVFCQLRRKLVLHRYFGMEIDSIRCKFFFNCDEGRLMRPLIICSEIPRLVQLLRGTMFKYLRDPVSYLLQNGFVEYLDSAEEYCGFVVVGHTLDNVVDSEITFTHMEIHGCFSLAMGVSKAFADCNQGPRRMLTGNMEKRSIGVKIHPDRGTTDSHCLWYGQDNLLSEPVDKSLGSRHNEPNGKNVMIMILSDEYNIEDCWKICKSSIELGMGISTKNHIFTTSLSANCIFAKPNHLCTGRASPEKYDHLNPDGLPIIGSILRYGDAVVGKIIEFKESNIKKYRCMSKFIPWFSEYRVEKVECLPAINPKTLRITLIQVNHPIIGNKYYLQHGQKGTCGDITSKEDMPFICCGPNAGMTPDIITNVASLMRVTSGLLLEMLIGKARAMRPSLVEQYSNIFIGQIGIENKLKIARHIFKEAGANYSGKDMVRSGDTGRLKNCEVFWGPAKVGVLKHMARDKLRGRERGTTIDLTRQPPAGFMQNGGQKFGEMENWNLVSWGTCSLFRNMNYHSAEKFMMLMCNRCSMPAIGCITTNVFFCKICKKSDEVVRVLVPYITNLWMQETSTVGWSHKLITQKAPPNTSDEMAIFHTHRLKMSD